MSGLLWRGLLSFPLEVTRVGELDLKYDFLMRFIEKRYDLVLDLKLRLNEFECLYLPPRNGNPACRAYELVTEHFGINIGSLRFHSLAYNFGDYFETSKGLICFKEIEVRDFLRNRLSLCSNFVVLPDGVYDNNKKISNITFFPH